VGKYLNQPHLALLRGSWGCIFQYLGLMSGLKFTDKNRTESVLLGSRVILIRTFTWPVKVMAKF